MADPGANLMSDAEDDAAGSAFSAASLHLDAATELRRISEAIHGQVTRQLRRRGAVVGLSGGVDSSVTAALCVEALGRERVFAVLMPERDSDPESLELGRLVARQLGIESVVEDIAPALEALGCYKRRDTAIRRVVPEYGTGWSCKLVLDSALRAQGYNLSSLVVRSPEGQPGRHRLPLDAYLAIVAAANMKQRTRKQIEYHHADRLNYAVAGTPNRLEYVQGFFVKNGDGAADFKPIAHLYKTQIYQLAEHFRLPEAIRTRPPTTDTWSLPQTQEEFYFSAPYNVLDLCLLGLERGLPAEAVARGVSLAPADVCAIWRDIESKRRVARYLHAAPLTVDSIDAATA